MNLRKLGWFGLAAGLVATPAAAQENINTLCRDNVPAPYQDRCAAVAQAVDAAQPQLGILMAGGNPILGTASTGGVRLGVLPRVSATARLNVVLARLPDIREIQTEDGTSVTEQFDLPAPAIGANVSIGLTQGFSVAPMIGGFGAVDLLGSVSVLPLELLGDDDFGENAFSWGAGARVALLRESFVAPGVSVSLMYRSMGEMSFGQVCEGTETSGANPHVCSSGGDFGEISFGLTNWSGRAAVSKRLIGFGVTAGVGYDKFETDADMAFRTPAVLGEQIYRFDDVAVDNDRWSAFLDLSYTLLIGSLVAEVGWMQGSDPVPGFPSASDFDPNEGTFFGSLGARLSL